MWIDCFCQYSFCSGNIIDDFIQAGSFHFFSLYIFCSNQKIENNTALLKFFDQQGRLVCSRNIF